MAETDSAFINALGKSINGAENNILSRHQAKVIVSRTWGEVFQQRTDLTHPDLEKGHGMTVLKDARKTHADGSFDDHKRML